MLDSLLSQAASLVWGPWLVALLFGTHLFLTWKTGFIQKHLGTALRLSVAKDPGAPGDISQFSSLMTALAATIGMGNIYGVAGAVLIGGPGAVFWMWLTGVFGIATKYSEALLAVKYRIQNSRGEMSGGPMFVLERGLNARWAGILFALFTAVAAFGIGNMAQSNAIAEMVLVKKTVLGLTQADDSIRLGLGLAMAGLTAVVILGGIKSIARFCGFLVPLMAGFYVLGCLVILVSTFDRLPAALSLIVTSAFTGHAAVGGFLGAGLAEAMRYGIARGLFSNESGLGSAPIAAAAARTSDPVRQALVSGTGTFWDTVVVCALTGLVVVSSGDWTAPDLNKARLCDLAFNHIGALGDLILIGGLLTFVFSTILGWGYYGEKAVEYLFGVRSVFPYRLFWVVAVFIGAIWKSDAVWNFCDIMNGLMALPNLVALLLLSGVITSETRRYFSKPS
ncbi:MAG: sodium:alanine symporter family protein [Verrucomicrobia bacterium]|nr:sodium:alanine symporter family protein [Verrucomicrobiota bacterium]